MGRMRKTSHAYCVTCKYHFGGDSRCHQSQIGCEYILKTGKRRNCPIGKCDKYEPINKEERNKEHIQKWKDTMYIP